MRSGFITTLLLALLVGCTEKPPFATDKPLTQSQLTWYVQRATTWLDSDESLWNNSVDRTKPATSKLLADTNTVEVRFATRLPDQHVFVRLDVHTGKIQSSGKIITETFQ